MNQARRFALTVAAFSLFAFAPAVQASVGDAGCGLGSMIIDKNTKLSQSLALTTNNTFLTNLFGITSGTSNCTSEGFAVREKEAVMFAEANMQNLKVEMARGQGENLTALAQLMGCQQNVIGNFGQMTQSQYENILPNEKVAPQQLINNVEKQIQNSPKLKAGCTVTT